MSLLRRFWITTAISLLCCPNCLSQDDVIILPTEIVRQMFNDVKERDQLRYELHKKDSTIHAYESKEKLYEKEVLSLKLSRDKYEEVVTNLEEVVRIRETQLQVAEQKFEQAGRRTTLLMIGEAALFILLTLLIL